VPILADELETELGDVFALGAPRLGRFDVVLNLGPIYHVEDPIGAIRRARERTAPGDSASSRAS
jgi:tRNA (mo5U34)-methyltransferase